MIPCQRVRRWHDKACGRRTTCDTISDRHYSNPNGNNKRHSGLDRMIEMAAWRNLALRMPIIRQWRERREFEFVVGDIVIEAPKPQVSKSVRKSLRKNDYETAETYLVRRLVRPGNTVLDLGAGLGLTSIVAAKASGHGRVVGYEADPVVAPLAEKNVRRNGVQVEIRNKAIAKEKGACEFHVRRSFTASSIFPSKGSRKILVEADAFQDVVDEIQPDVIVCDIEGIEKEVFASANLSSVHRMVLEVHPQVIGLLAVLKCVLELAASGLSLVESLSFGQVLVFDRDGSSSSIEPFKSDRQKDRKTAAVHGAGMA